MLLKVLLFDEANLPWYNTGGINAPVLFVEATVIFVLTDYANYYKCDEEKKILVLQNILKALVDGWLAVTNNRDREPFIINNTETVSELITQCESNSTNMQGWTSWASIQEAKDINKGISEFNAKVFKWAGYVYIAEGNAGRIQRAAPMINLPSEESAFKEQRFASINNNLSQGIPVKEFTPVIINRDFAIFEDAGNQILQHFARHWHGQLTSLDSLKRKINKNMPILK